jgi:hypothetical protein
MERLCSDHHRRPEPSTYLAATGLVALMPWPLCRRKRGKVSPGGAIPAVQGADG